jgi:hypothetical protein
MCFSSNYSESGRWTKSENPVILWTFYMVQNLCLRKFLQLEPVYGASTVNLPVYTVPFIPGTNFVESTLKCSLLVR